MDKTIIFGLAENKMVKQLLKYKESLDPLFKNNSLVPKYKIQEGDLISFELNYDTEEYNVETKRGNVKKQI